MLLKKIIKHFPDSIHSIANSHAIINLNKILDYYKLENLIIFNITKEYNSEDGKIYFNGSVNDIKNSKDIIISSFVNGKEILDLGYEKQ